MQLWDPWLICRQMVALQLVFYVGIIALEVVVVGVLQLPQT